MIPRHLIIGVSIMLAVVLGMGLYMWHMRGREVAIQPANSDNRPVGPPVSGPTEQVTLYIADDTTGTLHAQSAQIPLPAGRQQRTDELLRALLSVYLSASSPHVLGAGSEVRDVYLVNPGLAVIDTNAAFADGHRSGALVETLTVASLVQTLSGNIPGITQVKILVDGKQRDTLAGHADLTGFFDVAAVNQMVGQLQTSQ